MVRKEENVLHIDGWKLDCIMYRVNKAGIASNNAPPIIVRVQ